MMTIDQLASQEGEHWLEHTENLILRFDAVMFPDEQHKIFTTSDIQGEITYQDEHETYLFNGTQYFEKLKKQLERANLPPEASYYEVQRTAVILSACAVRLRAWELFSVPLRTIPETLGDNRIPWEIRRTLNNRKEIRALMDMSRGSLQHLPSGVKALQNIDLAVVASLSRHMYSHGLPIEWLRPFILA